MKTNKKQKQYFTLLLFIIAFISLGFSITRKFIETYTVSSTNDAVYVPIIMYHQVKGKNLGKDVISPYEFESDLKYLTENNYNTITMSDLINYVYNDKELPKKPIILTFDDGYLSTYVNVYPLLKEYECKIVLSLVGKCIDDYSKVDDNNVNYAHITWKQVKEMSTSGHVEMQNHTYNLHKIKNGRYGCYQKDDESILHYENILTKDIQELQEKVELATEHTPTTFTYPYGKYNDTTESIVKKLGFKATLSCTYGVNKITHDPESLYGLKRMCRSHNYPIEKLIKDGLETLKYAK